MQKAESPFQLQQLFWSALPHYPDLILPFSHKLYTKNADYLLPSEAPNFYEYGQKDQILTLL
jgi:hypothetical protein